MKITCYGCKITTNQKQQLKRRNNNIVNTDIGKRLRRARKMAGMSLADASNKIENAISRQCIHKYENGRIKISNSMLLTFATIYGVPVNFFYQIPAEEIKLEDIKFTFNK